MSSDSFLLAPVPLPGECVFSIAARFTEKWFRSTRNGAGLLVGRKTAPADPNLPRHLELLAQHLPLQLGLDVDALVWRHTSLPIHLAFLEKPQCMRVIEAAGRAGHLPFLLGTGPSRIVPPRSMRLCLWCVQNDLDRFGASYWHREHQVSGILICPLHGYPLSISDLQPNHVYGTQRFSTPASSSIIGAEEIESNWRPHLAKIAGDLNWLLETKAPCPGPHKLHSLYTEALSSRGFLRKDGSVRHKDIAHAMEHHFGMDLLVRLDCEIQTGDRHGWLPRITRRVRHNQHPLRHLLLIHFLGHTCSSALTAATACEYVGPRPAARPHANRIRNLKRLKSLLPIKRAEWIRALKAERKGSVRDLHPTLYAWLWRNSHQWLLAHKPKAIRQTANRPNKLWSTRDLKISAEIPLLATQLRSRKSPYTRASRNAIASQTGHASWLFFRRLKLPLSVNALELNAESAEQFALRRLEASVLDISRPCKEWRLRVAAGISATLAKRPAVAAALRDLVRQTA